MGLSRRDFTCASLAGGALLALGPRGASAKADALIQRAIPSSGEKIPIIGLGTDRFGGGRSDVASAPLREVVKRFADLGGKLFDTAPSYHGAETLLGDLVDNLGIRSKLFVATKVEGRRRGTVAEEMQQSFTNLKIKRCDLMQVHNLGDWQNALPVIRDWRDAGRIRYVGITTSREGQYDEMEKIMRAEALDFIQVNYSLEEREAADRILPLAAERGIAVIVNLPFGGGRIFRAVGEQPLPAWAADFDCRSWAQFLLKYALSNPAVTVAIPGMTKANHVDDNVAAATGRLPDAAQRKRQETFFNSL